MADLKALKPLEFQNWVIRRIYGSHHPRKSGDTGIDGYSFFEHLPVQVKQSERVGRPVVDEFQTAVGRTGMHKGYIVAFSFSRDAKIEAARVKAEKKGPDIELVEVKDLTEGPPDAVTPKLIEIFKTMPGPNFLDLPEPEPRPRSAMPSLRQLAQSETVG